MFKDLLTAPETGSISSLLIQEAELSDHPANIRLTVASLFQAAEEVAEEYGGSGEWTLGVYLQNKLASAKLFNECWLRVPLSGLPRLTPGFGNLATGLDGPTTEHRAKWKGLYVCAYLSLFEELK